MLFVDVETRLGPIIEGKQEQTLWFGWCCYVRRRPDLGYNQTEYYRFTTTGEFWSILASRTYTNRPLYLVSHNAAFDFGVLGVLDRAVKEGYEIKAPYIQGMSVIMPFVKGKYKFTILDNGNYFHSSLADLGAAMGYPKGDANPLTDPESVVDPYCHRDVEILVEAWQHLFEFMDDHDLGSWGKTISSIAFNSYRHRFMSYPIWVHTNQDALNLERAGYHGGRATAFYQGTLTAGPYYKLDVNSMYPWVMHDYPYPHDLYAVRDRPTLRYLEGMLTRFDVMADVTVHTDINPYPVTLKGHLVYPVGTFRTVLTTPEVRFALAHGHIIEVHRIALYFRDNLFAEYVDYFYALKRQYKREGNKPYYHMVKLMLNSLYGKTGQKSRGYELYEGAETLLDGVKVILNLGTGKRQTLTRFGDQYFIEVDRGESYNSFPAIAAHVTAYGRLALWKFMQIAGPGHYFYCDTDSLIVDETGKANLECYIDSEKLGALKVEGQSDALTVTAPKDYVFEGHRTLKGIGSKDKPLGGETYECTQFPSFRTQGHWETGTPFHTRQIVKHLSGTITDGTVKEDGWITPLNAEDYAEGPPLPSEALNKVYEIDVKIEALHESITLGWRTVLAMYDPARGTWKRGRDRQGNLVPLEYSEWDSKATELGYSSLTDLQDEVLRTVDTMRQIQDLKVERFRTLHPTPPDSSYLDQVPLD